MNVSGTVTTKFLLLFLAGYVVFKAFLYWRLQVALRRWGEKQRALKSLPSFDATRQEDDPAGPPRASEL